MKTLLGLAALSRAPRARFVARARGGRPFAGDLGSLQARADGCRLGHTAAGQRPRDHEERCEEEHGESEGDHGDDTEDCAKLAYLQTQGRCEPTGRRGSCSTAPPERTGSILAPTSGTTEQSVVSQAEQMEPDRASMAARDL